MIEAHIALSRRAAVWVGSVVQDLRYAARSLVNQPSFSAMAVFALVLGIGLNTSVFTGVSALLNRQWSVPDADRVVILHADNQFFGAVSAARFLNENGRGLDGVVASRSFSAQPTDSTAQDTAFVTGNFFDVLDVPMATGRGFRAEEDVTGAPATVAVISHYLWTAQFSASPSAIGSTVRVDGVPFTVIGVAAASFGGIEVSRTDIWLPFATYPVVRGADPGAAGFLTDPNRCCATVAARLADGTSAEQARAELSALYRRYAAQVNRDPTDIAVTGTAFLDDPMRQSMLLPILALVGAAFGSILLLACANVANLMLARAAMRQREIAVRTAIGAGRWRVIRQLLTESLLLALVAGVVSLALAFALPELVVRFVDQQVPTNLNVTPNGHVLAFAIGVAGLAAIAFGLVPALRGTQLRVADAMKGHSAHASPRVPLRGALLGVQVAISVALLVAAALLVRGLDRARDLDPGFRTDGVAALRVTLPSNAYDLGREAAFYDELISNLESSGVPAAVSMLLPLGDRWENTGFGVQCNTDRIVTQRVSRGFFDVLGIPLVAGSTFPASNAGRGSMVVDESLVQACWAGANPIGQTVNILGTPHEIVGVARNAQLQTVGLVQPTYYAPFVPDGNLVSGPAFVLLPSASAPAAAAAVQRLEPLAAADTLELTDQANRALGGTASIARIAGALGLLALLLATIGVYGVVSYWVEQQRHEIGIRLALGARPAQVVGLILRRNGRAVAIGLGAGLVIAAAVSVVLRNRLYGLSPLDPVAHLGVVVLLGVAGIAASIIPARRAARTDAVTALHQD